ncbi:unnamed protein product [Amoebophrya sp. A120]|nr:unnamed protein product [Amoebophrya sp. A120]|eukprot:GSA120T00008159001.1
MEIKCETMKANDPNQEAAAPQLPKQPRRVKVRFTTAADELLFEYDPSAATKNAKRATAAHSASERGADGSTSGGGGGASSVFTSENEVDDPSWTFAAAKLAFETYLAETAAQYNVYIKRPAAYEIPYDLCYSNCGDEFGRMRLRSIRCSGQTPEFNDAIQKRVELALDCRLYVGFTRQTEEHMCEWGTCKVHDEAGAGNYDISTIRDRADWNWSFLVFYTPGSRRQWPVLNHPGVLSRRELEELQIQPNGETSVSIKCSSQAVEMLSQGFEKDLRVSLVGGIGPENMDAMTFDRTYGRALRKYTRTRCRDGQHPRGPDMGSKRADIKADLLDEAVIYEFGSVLEQSKFIAYVRAWESVSWNNGGVKPAADEEEDPMVDQDDDAYLARLEVNLSAPGRSWSEELRQKVSCEYFRRFFYGDPQELRQKIPEGPLREKFDLLDKYFMRTQIVAKPKHAHNKLRPPRSMGEIVYGKSGPGGAVGLRYILNSATDGTADDQKELGLDSDANAEKLTDLLSTSTEEEQKHPTGTPDDVLDSNNFEDYASENYNEDDSGSGFMDHDQQEKGIDADVPKASSESGGSEDHHTQTIQVLVVMPALEGLWARLETEDLEEKSAILESEKAQRRTKMIGEN